MKKDFIYEPYRSSQDLIYYIYSNEKNITFVYMLISTKQFLKNFFLRNMESESCVFIDVINQIPCQLLKMCQITSK